LAGALLAGCGSDDSESCDTVPALSQNIIGEWSIDGGFDVEFKTDGTFIDDADPMIETSLQGVLLDKKTWEVVGSVLTITSSNEAGTLSSTDDFTALEEECDRIVFEYISFDWVFERR
jgi:hypothetical protein